MEELGECNLRSAAPPARCLQQWVMTAAYWRLAWLRYAQIVAVSSLAALAAAVLAVHLQSGRDDDDDDDGGGDDKSNRVGGPSQSRVQFANSVFAAVLWLLVTSAVLLGPYTKFSLLARAEWSGRSAFDLALARVILILLYMQDCASDQHGTRWMTGHAGKYTVRMGLLPDPMKAWDRHWMSRWMYEPHAMGLFTVLALLGVCARPALLGLAVLEMRSQLFQRANGPGRHHSGAISTHSLHFTHTRHTDTPPHLHATQ